MRKLTKWGVIGIGVAMLFGAIGLVELYATNPWDTVKNGNAGCSITYCSACGGTERYRCGSKQRYCSFTCAGENQPHNQCMQDDGC